MNMLYSEDQVKEMKGSLVYVWKESSRSALVATVATEDGGEYNWKKSPDDAFNQMADNLRVRGIKARRVPLSDILNLANKELRKRSEW